MENSSASSALVCRPARHSSTRCASCAGLSLGCLPRSRPLALATFMPPRVSHPDQVRLEFGDHREDVEQQPPDRVVRVVHRAAMLSFTPASVSSPAMSRASGEGAGEPIQLGHHERVAGPARGQRLTEPGPGPAGPGKAVVDVDAVRLHAERGKCVALGGEVLGVGGATRVPDEHAGHRMTVAVELPSPGIFAGGYCGNPRCPASWHCTISGHQRRCPLGDPLTRAAGLPGGALDPPK
jgi:hypothetical protein